MRTFLPRKIGLQGFRSFKTERTLEFPTRPGLYLMRGENRLFPELGPNGVGKSSVFEGLCWILEGKTSRGLSGKDVANWDGEDTTAGWLDFLLDDQPYRVARTWSPNTLTIQEGRGEPKPISQEDLDRLLGFGRSAFLSINFMGQFGDFFFDLPPREKLAIFSEALDLGVWEASSKKAAKVLAEGERTVRALEIRVGEVDGALKTKLEDKEKAEAALEKIADEVATARAEIEEEIRPLEESVATKEAALDRLKKSASRGDRDAAKETQNLAAIDAAIEEKDREIRTKADAVATIKAKGTAVEREHARMKGLAAECPSCRQKVPHEHRDEILAGLAEELRTLRDARTKADAALATAEGDRARLRSTRTEVEGRVNEARTAAREYDRNLATKTSEIADLKRKIGALAEELRGLDREEDSHREAVDAIAKEIPAIERRKSAAEDELSAERGRVSAAEFWRTGFKDVRLWLVSRALDQLTAEVGSSIVELGLLDWAIKFAVERETEAGGTANGFTVTITSPESPEGVKWEAWSGGETQRLRIAGAIGLANLLAARKGIRPAWEVWDEPTAHLSEEGVEDLVRFFADRARAEGRVIWIVDHRALSSGAFDGQTLVFRDENGTGFERLS